MRLWLFLVLSGVSATTYTPDWKSLDSRPLPAWYDEAKIGIILHYGVWTVPAFGSPEGGKVEAVWFWEFWRAWKAHDYVKFVNDNNPPGWTYADYAVDFKAELYNATKWAELFYKAGAKYVVPTAKHHDGFCMYPTNTSFNWNSMDVGPKRDVIGELADAVRKTEGVHFGLYHSLYEWFNPMYMADKANNYETQTFVDQKTMPELYELVYKYKPELIWSDGEWEAGEYYFKSKEFLAWLYNHSPVKDVVVVDDRWGKEDRCIHGGYLTCADRYLPVTIQKRKFENAMTLDRLSWGYSRTSPLRNYLSEVELLQVLVQTIACGGNLLINVGPTGDGTIHPIFEERLNQLGAFLNMAGEGVYGSSPWLQPNESSIWYTTSKGSVYAFVTGGFTARTLTLLAPISTAETNITLLGYPHDIIWNPTLPKGGVTIEIDQLIMWDLPKFPIPVFKLSGLHKSQQRAHEYAQYYSGKAPPYGTTGDLSLMKLRPDWLEEMESEV